MSPFSIAASVFSWIADAFDWLADLIPDIPFLGDWARAPFKALETYFDSIASAFTTLDDLWDYSWDRIIGAWGEIGKVWNWIWDCGEKAYNFFLDAGGWLWGQLVGVYRWVEGHVLDAISAVKYWFLDTLPGYFADFGKWVWDQLDELDAIWESKWSPLKPLIDFWTWNAKQLVDFTSDPVGYLAAALGGALALFLQTAGWPFLRVIEAFLVRIWDEEE